MSAAITPGIHPKTVRIKTIKTEPHPLSITAKGGKRTESITLHKLILNKSTIIILYREDSSLTWVGKFI